MSMDSSDLLSEDTLSADEGPSESANGTGTFNKSSFSFHRYLDEVTGTGDDSSSSESVFASERYLDLPTESGLSYDESVYADVDNGTTGAVMAFTNSNDDERKEEGNYIEREEPASAIEKKASRTKINDSNEHVEITLLSSGDDNSASALLSSMELDASSDVQVLGLNMGTNEENVQMIEDMAPDLLEEEDLDLAKESAMDDDPDKNENIPQSEKDNSDANVYNMANENDMQQEFESGDNDQSISVQSPPHLRSSIAAPLPAPSIVRTPQRLSSAMSQISSPSKTPPPSIKRVRMSPMTKTTSTPSKRGLNTPRLRKQQPQSKRPKIISPFSPRARKMRLQTSSTDKGQGAITGYQIHTPSQSQVQWSMMASRKVSILLNIIPHLNAPISCNDEENTLCLYPGVVADDAINSGMSINMNSPARSIKSSYSVTSQASILNKAGPGQEVILVDPNAFGDKIPTSVTVETARVVQQFSNIASEDWVRKYRFDEVCWPDMKQLIGIKKQNTNSTMEDISRAAVADVLNGHNAVLFGYGQYQSGRLESMFGSIAGEFIDPLSTLSGLKSIGHELGLLGLSVSMLLDKHKVDDSRSMTFKVTIIEIFQDNVLRDLLMDPKEAAREDKTALKLRHPDTKGAFVDNATELNIESMADLRGAVKRAFHSRYNLKARKLVGGRGHIITTVHIFPQGDTKIKSRKKKNFGYPLLQLVDLACAQTDQMDQEDQKLRTSLENTKIQNRRVASIRKSMAGLGALLRGQVVHEARRIPQSSLYRSCTLTKLVQRALDNETSRAVMISTVCPRRSSYDGTLLTLNFMHKLLVRPGKTAESPFETKGNEEFDGRSMGGFFSPGDHSVANSVAHSVASSVASEAIRSEFIHAKGTRAFMKSLVTDPRQRLATLLSPKDSPVGSGYNGGVPMKEITTINEVGNDLDDEDRSDMALSDSKHFPGESPACSGFESLDSSLEKSTEKDSGKVSILSDEIFFGERDEKLNSSSHSSENLEALEKNNTFVKVLRDLDQIDAGNKLSRHNDDSDYLVSPSDSSVESLGPLELDGAPDDIDSESKISATRYEDLQDSPEQLESLELHQHDKLTEISNINTCEGEEFHQITADAKSSEDDVTPSSEQPFQRDDIFKDSESGNDGEEKTNCAINSYSSRPDPDGKTADELTVRASSQRIRSTGKIRSARERPIRYGGNFDEESESHEGILEYSGLDQSVVSTLTPNVMTRQSSEESYSRPDSEESFHSEESYPRTSSHDELSEQSDFRDSSGGSDIQAPSAEVSVVSCNSFKEYTSEGEESFPLLQENSSNMGQERPIDDLSDSEERSARRESVSSEGSRIEGSHGDERHLNSPYTREVQNNALLRTASKTLDHLTSPYNSAEVQRRGLDPDAFYDNDIYHDRVVDRTRPKSSSQNSVHVAEGSSPSSKPKGVSAILSEYGFDSVVNQEYDAPSMRRKELKIGNACFVDQPIHDMSIPSLPTSMEGSVKENVGSSPVQDQALDYKEGICNENMRGRDSSTQEIQEEIQITEPNSKDESNYKFVKIDSHLSETVSSILNIGERVQEEVDQIVNQHYEGNHEQTYGSEIFKDEGGQETDVSDNRDSSRPIDNSCVDDLESSSTEVISTEENYNISSPTKRRVKKSVVTKVQSLVGESNAFLAYSPDGIAEKDFSDNKDSSRSNNNSYVDDLESSSAQVILKEEDYYSSPNKRRVKKSVVAKVQSLVGESNAFRAYSPEGKVDTQISLENYKSILKESLRDLEGEIEGSSIDISSDSSARNEGCSDEVMNIKEIEHHDLAYPASDGSSSDGESIDFDEVPINKVSRHSSTHNQTRATNTIDTRRSEELQKEFEVLQYSVKRCVESTNEAEVILELADDKLNILKSFNPDNDDHSSTAEDILIDTVKVLTSRTEALQSFIDSNVSQLSESRGAERNGQLEILDMNSRLEETLDEIQALRSANNASIDQIKEDHIESINTLRKEASNDLQTQEALESHLRQKALMVEGHRREISRLTAALTSAKEENQNIQSANSSMSHAIDDLKERLDKSITHRHNDNGVHADELAALLQTLDQKDAKEEKQEENYRRQIEELKSRLEKQTAQTERVEDELKSRISTFTQESDRFAKEEAIQSSLKDDMMIRHAEEIASKQRNIESIEKEVVKRNETNTELSKKNHAMEVNLKERFQIAENESKGREDLLRKRFEEEERNKNLLEDRFTDELNSLQTLLRSKNSQNEELKSIESQFQRSMEEKNKIQALLSEEIATLEKKLDLKTETTNELQDMLESIQSSNKKRLAFEKDQRAPLEKRILQLEETTNNLEATKTKIEQDFKEELSSLQKNLDLSNELNCNLEKNLKQTKESYDDVLNSKTTTETVFEEKITILEQRLMMEASEKEDIESDLLDKLHTLQIVVKKKTETIDSLQSASSQYEENIKLEKLNSTSLGEENVILKQRLKEEKDAKVAIETLMAKHSSTMGSKLDQRDKEKESLQQDWTVMKNHYDAISTQLNSVQKEKCSLNDTIDLLQKSLREELHSNKELNDLLSEMRLSQEEELHIHQQTIEKLSRKLRLAEENCADAQTIVECRNDEVSRLQDANSKLQDYLEDERKVKIEEESRLSQQLEKARDLLDEREDSNSDLFDELNRLKQERDSLKVEVATGAKDRNADKFSYEANISTLQAKLQALYTDQQTHIEVIRTLERETSVIKEKMSLKVEELSADITRLSEERKLDEAAKLELQELLKESSQDKQTLLDKISTQQIAFADLENDLSAEIEGRSIQEDDFLRKIEVLQKALQDCGESKKQLEERIRSLEENNERLNKHITVEQSTTEAVKLELKACKQENMGISGDLSGLREGRAQLEKELEAALTQNEALQRENSDTLNAVNELKLGSEDAKKQYSDKISKYRQKLEDNSKKLGVEKSKRLREKTSHATKIADVLDEAEKQNQRYLQQLSVVEEEKSTLDAELRSEIERISKLLAEATEKSLASTDLVREKADISEKMREKLSMYEKEVSSLNKALSKVSRESKHTTTVHTKTLSTLTQTIKENEETIVNQSEDMTKLLEENKSLGQKVKKANETQMQSKESYHTDTTKIKSALAKKEEETNVLLSQSKIQTSKIRTITEKLNAEKEAKNRAVAERTEVQTATKKLHSEIANLTEQLQKLSTEKVQASNEQKSLKEEIESKSFEIGKLKSSLESKVSKNKKLKEHLADARSGKEKIKQETDEALEESRAANVELSDALLHTKEELKAKIHQLEAERKQCNIDTDRKLDDLSSRISDLSIMKEALQTENVSLMQKVNEERMSNDQLIKRNKSLKSAISTNEQQLRNQMNDLEGTMQVTLSKIETKRKKSILKERESSKGTIEQLERKNDSFKVKITRLDSTIRQLERQISATNLSGNGSSSRVREEAMNSLQEENDILRRRFERLEQQQSQSSHISSNDHQHQPGSPTHTPGGGSRNYNYSIDFHHERDRRLKAEEFAAAMAARAKAGFEKRNEQIMGLRMRITSLEAEKENLNNRQALLMDGNMNTGTLELAFKERDDAIEEARKYRSIAKKLNNQVLSMSHQLELVEPDNYGYAHDGIVEGGEEITNFRL